MTSPTFDPGFSTSAMAEVVGPAARVAAMCRVEAALATGSADAGAVDRDVAERIVAACDKPIADPEAVLADGWETGTPVLPLLDLLRGRLDDEAAAWLHHGATTQDVVDTAAMLCARDGLAVLRRGLGEVARPLRQVAMDHRDTPAPGWTFLQPAVPVTVGLRAARWLSPVVAHVEAIDAVLVDLPLQLGGPTGTLAALGDRGLDVAARMADHLRLRLPALPWHTDRTPVAEAVGLFERIARTMATIGTDLSLLAHDGAVRMRAGGSSSMPGKRNPIDAIRAIAAAEACAGAASVVTRGRPHELERGVGGWHAEWWALPMALQTCGAAVEAIGRAVDTLEVMPGEVADGGPTPASGAFVDRVVAECDRVVGP